MAACALIHLHILHICLSKIWWWSISNLWPTNVNVITISKPQQPSDTGSILPAIGSLSSNTHYHCPVIQTDPMHANLYRRVSFWKYKQEYISWKLLKIWNVHPKFHDNHHMKTNNQLVSWLSPQNTGAGSCDSPIDSCVTIELCDPRFAATLQPGISAPEADQ